MFTRFYRFYRFHCSIIVFLLPTPATPIFMDFFIRFSWEVDISDILRYEKLSATFFRQEKVKVGIKIYCCKCQGQSVVDVYMLSQNQRRFELCLHTMRASKFALLKVQRPFCCLQAVSSPWAKFRQLIRRKSFRPVYLFIDFPSPATVRTSISRLTKTSPKAETKIQ